MAAARAVQATANHCGSFHTEIHSAQGVVVGNHNPPTFTLNTPPDRQDLADSDNHHRRAHRPNIDTDRLNSSTVRLWAF